jgi:hypothetical protein
VLLRRSIAPEPGHKLEKYRAPLEGDMRLSPELRREFEKRLTVIEAERPEDPAHRDLPRVDEWVFGLLVVGSFLLIFLL